MHLVYWFIKCRTLCKSSEVGWLKNSDVAQGPCFRPPVFPSFSRRPGKNSTELQKLTFIKVVLQGQVELGVDLQRKQLQKYTMFCYFI